jgi:hypothetical protein
MNEPDDAEQHGSIVNFVFWLMLAIIVLGGIALCGGPG